MPAWDDYKAEAKSRGALALELFVVHSTPAGAPEDIKANLGAHLDYQAEMEAQGKLMFAGPMSDETGDQMQGVGMIVYKAANMAEALSLAESDPMHSSGARSFTLRKWLVNEGGFSVQVRLSGQSVELG